MQCGNTFQGIVYLAVAWKAWARCASQASAQRRERMSYLAIALAANGKFEDALQIAKAGLDQYKSDHAGSILFLPIIKECCQDLGRHEEARRICDDALASHRAALAANPTVQRAIYLMHLLCLNGLFAEAQAFGRETQALAHLHRTGARVRRPVTRRAAAGALAG